MNTMSPSSETVSNGQIGKIQDLLGDALCKSGLAKDPTQVVIENQGAALASKLLGVVREFVEAASNIITRIVKVNRSRAPQEVLDATGRVQYTDKNVVKSMPKGAGEAVEVVFFKLDLSQKSGLITDDDLDKEYELRGLTACDPYSLAKVNEDDPAFADSHPNGTHWKDSDGNWCFASFFRWYGGERSVCVDRHGDDWSGFCWFAGVRKKN